MDRSDSIPYIYNHIVVKSLNIVPVTLSRDGRVLGIVEVSRSIGDGRFKHCGVIATPDVFRTQLTENDL